MNNEHIKHAIDQFPQEKFNNLTGIGLSHKVTNGETTGRVSITFSVREKLDRSQIPGDQMLPSEIQVGDQKIQTDVIQEDIDWQFENQCNQTPDIDSHRMTQRPVVGGTSLGIGDTDHRYKVGTLGAIVQDTTDGQLVGLSNNHVLCPEIFTLASSQSDNFTFKDMTVYQPSPAESGGVFRNNHKIGTIKRVYPLFSSGNEIDAGVFNINSDISVTGGMLGLLNAQSQQVTSIPFATTSEIDELGDGIPLFKSSRTSGEHGHPVQGFAGSCWLQAHTMYFSARVTGRRFSNLIKYADTLGSTDPSAGGDSGSVVCGWFDNQWKAVGLHFAGGRSAGMDYGLMCRMDRIAELLKIGPHSTVAGNGQTDPKYRVVYGHSTNMYVTIDGQLYWQAGRTKQTANTAIDFSGGSNYVTRDS